MSEQEQKSLEGEEALRGYNILERLEKLEMAHKMQYDQTPCENPYPQPCSLDEYLREQFTDVEEVESYKEFLKECADELFQEENFRARFVSQMGFQVIIEKPVVLNTEIIDQALEAIKEETVWV